MKKLLTLYLILSAFISFAQNEKIDSLQQALRNYDANKLELHKNLLPDESDTAKVNILNDLSWQFKRVSDYAAAKKYADEALVISQKIKFKTGMADSYRNIGSIYNSQSEFPEAIKNHSAAQKIYEEIGDKLGAATSINNIGNVYGVQGNYPEAMKRFFAVLKIYEESGDKKLIATTYNNIGVTFYFQGNYPKAIANHLASIKIREEIGDKQGISNSYNSIATAYQLQGNYPEALNNYFASLKLREELGDKRGICNSYYNIGTVYHAYGNYPEALKNCFSALKIAEEIGDKYMIAVSYNSIGSMYTATGKAAEGKVLLYKALALSLESGIKTSIESNYAALASADSALGNFKGAYEHHKLSILYRDSLNNEETTKKSLQTQMQYEFDKKESETKVLTDAELKKQKLVRNGFMGGFAVVLAFAGVFFRQRNKTTKEKKRSENLLLNILPVGIADEIKETGTVKAKAYTMATVMFTDFKDFTTVSEKVSAELLVDEIHTCFSAFDNILHKYNIEKIKTIGDAYLCASGLPVSNYTHAVDMLNAAFEIRSFMVQRKKEKEARGEIPFELRIGIHTGPVVAGIVGVKKYAYDIWGDTVNIAARVEQNSEAGKINISGSTYELVKDKFNCTHRGKISAKNKGEIDMYFVETNGVV